MDEHQLKHKLYRFGNYVLDTKQKLLFCGDDVVHLGQKSYECLLLLIENSGKVVLKETFFDKIWENSFVEDAVLAVNISALRKVFGEEKDGKKYIETFSRKGYRFIVQVEIELEEINEEFVSYFSNRDAFENELLVVHKTNQDLNDSNLLDDYSLEKDEFDENFFFNNTIIDDNSRQFKFSRIQIILLCGLMVTLIGVAVFLYQKWTVPAIPNTTQVVSIAIFPLENLNGDSNLNYLSISLPDSLNYSLLPIPNTKIISTSVIKKYIGQSYNPIEEGKKLGVNNIVTGSYQVRNGKILVNLQVTDISKINPISQQQQFESPVNDLTGLQNPMYQFLIFQLNLARSSEVLLEIQKTAIRNPQAYEDYMRGINATIEDKRDSAITYFSKVLKTEPDFLPALENLGLAYLNQAGFSGCGKVCLNKGIEYYERIVRIAPNYKRVKLSLAMIYLNSNRIDEAMALTKEFINDNPDSKYADFVLAVIYRFAGTLEESVEAVERGRRKDDVDSVVSQIIMAYLYLGKYDEFIETMRYPSGNEYGSFYKGFGYYYLKKYPEAHSNFENSFKTNPDTLTSKISKIYFLHIQEKDQEALKILNEVNNTIIQNQVSNGEIIYNVAQANAELKQTQEALEMLSLSVDSGFFCYPFFVNDSLLNNLRSESQFNEILEKARKRHEDFKSKFLK